MSFWTDFSSALSKAVVVAKADIEAVAQYFKPMLITSAEELGEIALQAVLAEAPKVISGAEKLSNATSTVLTDLGAAGKKVAISDATTAVQAAYTEVSNSLHPTT